MPEPKLQVISNHKNHEKSQLGILCIVRALYHKEFEPEFIALKNNFKGLNFTFGVMFIKRKDNDYHLVDAINKSILHLSKKCSHILIADHFIHSRHQVIKTWLKLSPSERHNLLISQHDKNLSQLNFLLTSTQSFLQIGGFSPWLVHPKSLFKELSHRAKHKQFSIQSHISKDDVVDQSGFFREPLQECWEKQKEIRRHVYFYQNHLLLKKPDFLIIGAQKAGSTSLIKNMEKHPDIHAPIIKLNQHESREMHFFNTNLYEKMGEKWYLSLFYHPHKKCSGEKTPEYFPSPQCHERMHHLLPNTQLFLSLRNPIDRAFSAIQHLKREKQSWGPPEFANKSPEECFDLLCQHPQENRLISVGHYAQHLESLLSYYPKEQVHIYINENMERDHDQMYREIFTILNINPNVKVPKRKFLVGKYEDTRNKNSIEFLKEYYKPHNERLFNLLGYEIPEWN